MDKNLHDDNLEDFFRKELNKLDESPPDDIWDDIEMVIQPVATPSNSRLLWYRWASVAALLLIGLVAYTFIYQKNNTIEMFSQKLEEQSKIIDSLQKEIEASNVQKNEPSKYHLDKKNTITEQRVENIITPTPRPTISKKTITHSSKIEQKKKERLLKNVPYNNTVRSSSLKNNPIKKLTSSIVSTPSPPTIKVTTPFVKQQKKPSPFVREKPLLTTIDSSVIIPAILPIDFLPTSGITVIKNNQPTLPIYPTIYSFKAPHKTVSIGIYTAPIFTYRTIQEKETKRRKKYKDLDDIEEGNISMQLGLKAELSLGRHWAIQSGVNYNSLRLQSKSKNTNIEYTQQGEQAEGDDTFTNTYSTRIETSYGVQEIEFTSIRKQRDEIPEGTKIPISIQVENTSQHLGIPLIAKYYFGNQRFRVALKGGLQTNFLLKTKTQLTAFRVNRNGVNHRSSKTKTRTETNTKNVSLDYIAGVDLSLLLNEKLTLNFEPTYQQGITSIYEYEKIDRSKFLSTKNYALGLQMGLKYHF